MNNNYKIKIFCTKSGLCTLMQKVLAKYDYAFECIKVDETTTELTSEMHSLSLNSETDVLILDKDVSQEFKEKILSMFSVTPLICLPSLDSEKELVISENVHHLSEPFKLSEFEEVLTNIINSKKEKNEN